MQCERGDVSGNSLPHVAPFSFGSTRLGVREYMKIDPNAEAAERFMLAEGHYGALDISKCDKLFIFKRIPELAVPLRELLAWDYVQRTSERRRHLCHPAQEHLPFQNFSGLFYLTFKSVRNMVATLMIPAQGRLPSQNFCSLWHRYSAL